MRIGAEMVFGEWERVGGACGTFHSHFTSVFGRASLVVSTGRRIWLIIEDAENNMNRRRWGRRSELSKAIRGVHAESSTAGQLANEDGSDTKRTENTARVLKA